MTTPVRADVATLTKNTDVSGLAKQFETQVNITPKPAVTPRPSVIPARPVSETAKIIQRYFSFSKGDFPNTSSTTASLTTTPSNLPARRRVSDANPLQQHSSRRTLPHSTSDERTSTVILKPSIATPTARPVSEATRIIRYPVSFSEGDFPNTSSTNGSLTTTPSHLPLTHTSLTVTSSHPQVRRRASDANPPQHYSSREKSPRANSDDRTNTVIFSRAVPEPAGPPLSPASNPSVSPSSISSDENGSSGKPPVPPRPRPYHLMLPSPQDSLPNSQDNSPNDKTNTIIHKHTRRNSGGDSNPPQIIISTATLRRNSMPALNLHPSQQESSTHSEENPFGPNLHQTPGASSTHSAASVRSNISVMSTGSTGSEEWAPARNKKTTPEQELEKKYSQQKKEIYEKTAQRIRRLTHEKVGTVKKEETTKIQKAFRWEQTQLMEELIQNYPLSKDLEILLANEMGGLLQLELPEPLKVALVLKTKSQAQLEDTYKDNQKKLQQALLQKSKTIDELIQQLDNPLSDELYEKLMEKRTRIVNNFMKNHLPPDLMTDLQRAKEEIANKQKESLQKLHQAVATKSQIAKDTIKLDGKLKKKQEKLATETERLKILKNRAVVIKERLRALSTDKSNALKNFDTQLGNISDPQVRLNINSHRTQSEYAFDREIKKLRDELLETEIAIKTLESKIQSESASIGKSIYEYLPKT